MADTDCCDIDTLTAFLEESDDDATELQNEKKDEQCDVDEITAFLEESDDEDNQGVNTDTDAETKDSICPSKDSMDADVERNTLQNNNKRDLSSENQGEDNEFSDLDDMDLDEIDNIEVTKNNTSASKEPTGTNQKLLIGKQMKSDITEEKDHCHENSGSRSGVAEGDEDAGMEHDVDVNEEQSDEEPSTHDAIKAEMLAMAERMKQLQDLLEKSTPKSKSKSKNGSPKTENKAIKIVKQVQNSSPSNTSKTSATMNKYTPTSKSKDNSHSKEVKDQNLKGEISNRYKAEKSGLKGSPNTSASRSDENKTTPSRNNSSNTALSRSNSSKTAALRTDSSFEEKSKAPNLSVSSASAKTFMKSLEAPISSASPKLMEKKHGGSALISKHSTQTSEVERNLFFSEEPDGSEVRVDSRTLFGDSDDSDWEDLAGDEKTKLSGEGKEMKRLLNQGVKKREAHVPNYDPAILKKPAVSTWAGVSTQPALKTSFYPKAEVEKVKLNPDTGTVSGKYRVREEYKPKVAVPTVEDNREFVKDPYCGIRIVNPRISMDSFKTKMDGRSLIKISRLLSKSGVTDLQKDNWVTLGVVVHKTEPRQSANGKTYCIWKLSDLVNCDQTVSFFLFGNVYKEHWKNKEGVVIGLLNPSIMDKAEKAQSEVALTINHPQQLLLMGVSKDLGRCKGTTKAGSVCGNFINRNQGEYCTYHVNAAYRKSSSKRTELQASTGRAPQAFEQKKRVGPNSSAGCFFYAGQTFTSMRPRTANTKDKVTLKKLNIMEAGKEQGKLTTMSLHDFKPEDKQKLDKIKEKDKQLLELLAVPTVGSMNFVKHLVKKDKKEKQVESNQPEVQVEVSAKDLLKQHQSALKQKQLAQKKNPLAALPKLGKGFQSGQEISLDIPIKKTSQTAASAELAKKLAIAKVKLKGGVDKEDPNAVRKKITSPENRDKIRKRVAEDMLDTSASGPGAVNEPPKKRSKLLGSLDLNSDEVQKLLKVKSKHKGALAEAEAEHEERYFSSLEKKERMEEKMDSVKEVPVTLYVCKQCNYRFYSLHDRCKQENHSVKRVNGVKRFFKCKQCKRRCTSLDKMPTKPCKECGSSSFERVSMLKEKAGPKLESEELSIRGNEQKYVGAIQGKAFLNV